MNTTTTEPQKISNLKTGQADILSEAPRVSSRNHTSSDQLKPLLELLEVSPVPYSLKRSGKAMKLVCKGARVSPKALARLLKKLPRDKRIDGATRIENKVGSFCFDGKLKKSPLSPPESGGLVLVWSGATASLKPQFLRLAKLAAKSKKQSRSNSTTSIPEASGEPNASRESDLIERLLESPKFVAAYQARSEDRPPSVTLAQILKAILDGGGQALKSAVQQSIGLPDHRMKEILRQIDHLLRSEGEIVLSTSLDGDTLMLDKERLGRLFQLHLAPSEDRVVRAETLEGQTKELKLPVEVTLKERRVLEALLRYGRLNEAELAQITASRRVGGLLQKLLTRFEENGFFRLVVADEREQGRIFQLV